MELEIRTIQNACSFMVSDLPSFMDEPRDPALLQQIADLVNTAEIWSEYSTALGAFGTLRAVLRDAQPFEPTGQAYIIINISLGTLVLKPNSHSYVHFPLYRNLPDWEEYLE